jgi:hypothetical protein
MKKTADTALKREMAALRVLLKRLGNGILNRIFALDIKGSRRRSSVLAILFLLAGMVLTFVSYPWATWNFEFQKVFNALLTDQAALANALTNFFIILLGVLIDPRILRFLPVLILPYLLSQDAAAKYLADIFEIEEIDIARKFIAEVALRGSNNELHISTSKAIDKKIEKSPISLIGGPGYVTVELDTAILVEKPDGRPRVIGPTHDDAKGRTILDGFERIRDMIDLRDQIPDPFEVSARSKDGIPISIADVRVVFSIFRDKKSPTPNEPHPFSPASIQALVFSKTNRVTEGEMIHQKWYRSSGEPIWVTPMKTLILRDLGIFMGTRNLGEYLASIGAPEVDAVKKIEEAIAIEKQKIGGGGAVEEIVPPPVPAFTSRSQLSGLFSEFAKKFNEEQQKRGVQAQWVGVGTWKMPPGIPNQVIPEKHLEAWRLTLENMTRGNEQAMDNLEKDSELLELQRLIQKGPIQTHQDNLDKNLKKSMALRTLMQVYSQQLSEVIERLRKTRQKVPPSIVAAYYYVAKQLYHFPTPKVLAPKSAEEKKLYTTALAKIESLIALERLIILEGELNPTGARVDHIKNILNAWDREMQ